MKQIYIMISLIFLLSVLVSCGSMLPTHYYRIDTDSEMNKVDQEIPLKVEVNSVRTPDRYRDRIVYREGEYEYGFYEYSRWIDFPGEMIRRSLINALSEAHLFALVDPFGNNSDSDLDLISEITSFDQVVEGEIYFADFGIILELSRSDNGDSVWSYRTEERIKQQGEGSFAAAMSEAVKKVINRAIVEMGNSKKLRELPAELSKEKKDIGISGN